ncbi:MAG: 2-amino-4-hydroxy-6-hydroxymethyldihydropteridine diphosphokinase [Deltaproteobacteria bacterium]
MMRDKVFISIGSNLGERVLNIRRAIEGLGENPLEISIADISSFYETEPWGDREQGLFINCVVEIKTALSPHDLLLRLKQIEASFGRTINRRWGPRVIDLDILFFGAGVINEKDLVVPHPRLQERAFVLAPLSELSPGFIHPCLGLSVAELLERVEDKAGIRILRDDKEAAQ